MWQDNTYLQGTHYEAFILWYSCMWVLGGDLSNSYLYTSTGLLCARHSKCCSSKCEWNYIHGICVLQKTKQLQCPISQCILIHLSCILSLQAALIILLCGQVTQTPNIHSIWTFMDIHTYNIFQRLDFWGYNIYSQKFLWELPNFFRSTSRNHPCLKNEIL